MTKLTPEQITYLKSLAKMLVDDGENQEYTRGILELLAYVDGKEDVDTEARSNEIAVELELPDYVVDAVPVLNVDVNEYHDIAYKRVFKNAILGCVEFFDGMHECTPPKNPRYRAGDIVVIEEDDGDGTVVGVVFGAISHATEELRTDARGMVSFDQIVRHATIEDIDTMDNRYKKIILDLLK
jgi:hypothetical protein